MRIEPPKSLFDYTDEEFNFRGEVFNILKTGVGRKYRDPKKVLLELVRINRIREMGRLKEIELKSKNLDPKQDWKLSLENQEFISLYCLGRNHSDLILEELEKAEKLKGEEKKFHLRKADEIYQYCKKEMIEIPQPIEDYFLQNRKVSSAAEKRKLYEDIREWYLENKPDYSPKRPGELLRWIFLVLILAVPIFLIVRFPDLLPLLVIGSVLLLISRQWGIAGILWALYLILRFLSITFKQ